MGLRKAGRLVTRQAAIGIALVALGLALTPGPNMMYLVSRAIVQGRPAGMISLLGVTAGFLVYLAAAAVGLASVIVAVPAAYLALKLTGVASCSTSPGRRWAQEELPSSPCASSRPTPHAGSSSWD